MASRYSIWRQQGLCGGCGKETRPGKAHCLTCYESQKRWVRNMPSDSKTKAIQTDKAWRDNNRNKIKEIGIRGRNKIKTQVIAAYGGICACCKESSLPFLSIDHIEGGGRKHRKEVGITSGSGFYRWLRDNNYPKGFQVLCYNCNCAKRTEKVCPHQAGH